MTLELLTDTDLRKRGIEILVRELGPGNSARFLTILNPPKRGTDSVKLRRKWLKSIDQEAFVADILEHMKQEYEKKQYSE